MNIDIFVEQWMGPESLDYYYIDWVVKEVKRLRKELDGAYNTIQNYEEVIEPKRLNKIERLEKALKSNGKYNAAVSATGNAGGGSIMVDVTFDDGDEYYGILDKVME
tara:strand:+ start:99 stop:419 length:321 start_codon:yes stop_codon:yes gene_type:complete